MAQVVIGGYRHHVPQIIDACIEELYRTGTYILPQPRRYYHMTWAIAFRAGIYQSNLFRTLPNQTRLFQLVSYYDKPSHATEQRSAGKQAANVTRASVPNLTHTVLDAEAQPRDRAASMFAQRRASTVTPPLFAHRTPLQHATHADSCALLVTYLTSLPVPLIHRSLADALWAWCVSPSILRSSQGLRRTGDADASDSSSSDSSQEDDEAPSYSARIKAREEALLNLPSLRVQIKIAREVLLLLPKRHFAVLLCLMNFFATVMVCPDSGLTADEVGRRFCKTIVGGESGGATKGKSSAQSTGSSGGDGSGSGGNRSGGGKVVQREGKGKAITAWLVKHWREISCVYEVEDDHIPDRHPAGRASRPSSISMPKRNDGYVGFYQRESNKCSSAAYLMAQQTSPRQQQSAGFDERRSTSSPTAGPISTDFSPSASPIRPNAISTNDHSEPPDARRDMLQSNPAHDAHGKAGTVSRPDRLANVEFPRASKRPAMKDVRDSPVPHLDFPEDLLQEETLFSTPAPFSSVNDGRDPDDDASVYSNGESASPVFHHGAILIAILI